METKQLIKKLIEYDFRDMNGRQFEAVTTVNGPLLVLAGAGSGKTTVLVNRTACLIKYGNAYLSENPPVLTDDEIEAAEKYIAGKCDTLPDGAYAVNAPHDWEILAITFTNKAADELKNRISAKLGSLSDNIWAGTFHSVCGRILRRYAEEIGYTSSFTIYDTDDQKRVMKDIIKTAGIDEKMFPPKSVLSVISGAKDSLIGPDEFESTAGNDYRNKTYAALYREYQRRLFAANAMDFDDMIANTVRLFGVCRDALDYYACKFRYIMVDEYQDTNHAQYELVRMLSSVHNNICVVGDDDQSIYRFRGATIENILSFEETFKNAKTVRLEQNYRSTGNILAAANKVIENNRGRKGKTLWTADEDGKPITVYVAESDDEEVKYVADSILENVQEGGKFSDNAILYRINAQSVDFETALTHSGIAYRIIGGARFYARKEIKDILAYLCVINNTADDLRLSRIINEPARGIGNTTLERIREIAAAEGKSMFDTLCRPEEYPILAKSAGRLKAFGDMMTELINLKDEVTLSVLLETLLEKSGYRDALISSTTDKSGDGLEYVEKLQDNIIKDELDKRNPSLSDFLESIALVSDIDSYDTSEDRVTLMTVHSAKGLEFENVFLVGMEENMFPPTKQLNSNIGTEELEEERRLAYVAITRAKKRLTITRAKLRFFHHLPMRNLPSRFLREIPEELCETHEAEPSYGGYNYGRTQAYGGYQKRSFGDYSYRDGDDTFGSDGFFAPFASEKPKRESLSAVKPAAKAASYSAGQSVEHKTFGKGMIISVKPMGNDTLLEIAFDSVGTKKIMANFANLKTL